VAKQTRKGKGAGGKDAAAPAAPSVAAHPQAARSVARMKAWAGLVGLVAVGLLSYRAGVPAFESAVRALGAGIALYLVAWAAGIAFWRQLVRAEVRQAAERRRELREQREAELRAEAEAAA